MSKKSDNDRKLRNRYAGEAAGAALNLLKETEKIKTDRDAWWLVYQIQALYSAVSFDVTKRKTTVHVSYYWLDGFASYIADKYDVDEYDIMRLILAPVFPGTEFTDDELKLIELLSKEESGSYIPFKKIQKKASNLFLPEDAVKIIESLRKKGIVSVENARVKLNYDFQYNCTQDILDKPLEEGKWYVDESLSLAYAENPHIPSHSDDLYEALRAAEEEYNTKWWAPIEKENERLRALFEEDLQSLKPTTRGYYLSDIDWFLDSYFYRETISSIHNAAKDIIDFFRYYICRCSCNSEHLLKRMASAIRRFYNVMYENGEVTLEERDCVISDIKNNMDWLIEAATDYEKRVEYFC